MRKYHRKNAICYNDLMDDIELNTYTQEKECDYKGEHYSARDNGAVLRHSKSGKIRPLDNKWTFGKANKEGYVMIAGIPIHRIVATAFHGEHPNKVVDHIDTNRQNNRPDNLRWVTKLENILLNPITRKKIEYHCGSIENFLEDPTRLPKDVLGKNRNWMRHVSQEEAQACLKNMQKWLAKPNNPKSTGQMGEWVFGNSHIPSHIQANPYTQALTPNAIQENWKTPAEFLFCPSKIATDTPVLEYLNNIQVGQACVRNKYHSFIAISAVITLDKQTMWVITQNPEGTKPWGVFRVIYEQDKFLHKNIGTFLEERGAEKCVCLECGYEWLGEEGIDDLIS